MNPIAAGDAGGKLLATTIKRQAPPGQIPGSPELCDRVVQAAEKAGFEYLLIPVGSTCWEAWISGAFMAARSKTI